MGSQEMASFPPPAERSGYLCQCFIKFRVPGDERFQALSRIFEILKQKKQKIIKEIYNASDDDGDDEEVDRQVEENKRKRDAITDSLFDLFDEQALSHFWWPSNKDWEEYWQRWNSTPGPQRFTDPALEHPWDFASMVDSLLSGEYEFLSCQLIEPDIGVLVFGIYSWPYGSSDAIKALVEAFDCNIVGADLGVGYVSYS
jgi:hypothetical protein